MSSERVGHDAARPAQPPAPVPPYVYTRPAAPTTYTHPILTVRDVSRPTPPGPSTQPLSTPSSRPPFIVSNALAAASGLHLAPRRAAASAATPASTAPPAVSAPSEARPVRLPPPKDLVAEDAELAAQRSRTQARLRAHLERDHERTLRPDTTTPFRDADDVVARLLPYHVWQLPERDLLRAMDARISDTPPHGPDAALQFTVPYRARPAPPDTPDAYLTLPAFPSEAYTDSVYVRHAQLQRRFAALQTRASTTHASAPCMSASLEHIERLLYEDELHAFQDMTAALRKARSDLEELERQHTPSIELPAVRPVLRPEQPRPAAPLSSAAVSHLAGLTPSPYVPPVPPGAASRPPAPPASVPAAESLSRPAIPTQPLPLVVPMTCVPRLTALGIHLVPATHLLPALSLASAGQSMAMNAGLTAPRPVVGVQNEPVLLVGITDAPTPLAPGASPASRQRLHLSVVLSKLRPEQLSGLAHIMQTLQHEDDPS